MASAISDKDDDLNWKGKCLWTENSRVYTRRKSKKAQNFSNSDSPSNASTIINTTTTTGAASNSNDAKIAQVGNDGVVKVRECATALSSKESLGQELRGGPSNMNAESEHVQDSILGNGGEVRDLKKPSPVHVLDNVEDSRQLSPLSCRDDFAHLREVGVENSQVESELCDVGESKRQNLVELSGSVAVNGDALKPLVISQVNDRIRLSFAKATPKNEIKDLSIKLESELDQIRNLMKRLESPEILENQPPSYSHASSSNINNGGNINGGEDGNIDVHSPAQPECAETNPMYTMPSGLLISNSEEGLKTNLETMPDEGQLTVLQIETNHGVGESVEKEKRTPKANIYYKSSEFLMGKDRLPSESAKRSKTSNGQKQNEPGFGFGLGSEKSRNQLYKNCTSLLQRLMKHKHGWVFNEPVNAEAMGCVDYHDIIKHPMDLGTIKTRLSQRSYENPSQFADDVRLVFQNAMTYNPRGHDVHTMAEQLSQIFEERWVVIETEFNSQSKCQINQDCNLPTPRPRKNPPRSVSTLDIPAKKTRSMAVEPKVQRMPIVRTPVAKKPKAKDPNKRNMTYEEKQKLSANLEKLPSEQLDAIIQIIKKRNTALSQNDDEIEVDIESVDAETLWELDRFVTNYKKNLSKKRQRAELALRARSTSNIAPMDTTNTAAASRNENGIGETMGRDGNKLRSSGSLSSDSGSSSSGK